MTSLNVTNNSATKRKGEDSSIRQARKVSSRDRVILYARAAGRCSFRGCNRDIVEHHLTREAGNFAEAAHIYAFSEKGPRGREAGRPVDPDTLKNLILLCQPCHTLVDDNPAKYTVADLRRHREEHEARVRSAVEVDLEHKTVVVTISAPIAGQPNAIAPEDIREAIAPRYVVGDVFEIAHALGPDETPATIEAAAEHVAREFETFLAIHRKHGAPPISIFGIAPIPLLIHLGARVGNKRETALFQLHRPRGWTWKTNGETVTFARAKKLRDGDASRVALLVNVSGTNGLDRLPSEYARATVYELAPIGREPDRTLIRKREDLDNFRAAYRETIEEIRRAHSNPSEVGLFPAVPIPFAIAMGADLLPKADPTLAVHDWRKDRFVYVMKVNA
jgi:hypothetical protein